MPQLDVTSFTAQILWLVAIYFTFYILLLKYILPRIGKVLKFRKNYKVTAKNKKQDRELTTAITSQLSALTNLNLSLLEKNNARGYIYSQSELNYAQDDFLHQNLQSLYIKRQLLEKNEASDPL